MIDYAEVVHPKLRHTPQTQLRVCSGSIYHTSPLLNGRLPARWIVGHVNKHLHVEVLEGEVARAGKEVEGETGVKMVVIRTSKQPYHRVCQLQCTFSLPLQKDGTSSMHEYEPK